eukprot:1885922-Rhodomonas_salina.3
MPSPPGRRGDIHRDGSETRVGGVSCDLRAKGDSVCDPASAAVAAVSEARPCAGVGLLNIDSPAVALLAAPCAAASSGPARFCWERISETRICRSVLGINMGIATA